MRSTRAWPRPGPLPKREFFALHLGITADAYDGALAELARTRNVVLKDRRDRDGAPIRDPLLRVLGDGAAHGVVGLVRLMAAKVPGMTASDTRVPLTESTVPDPAQAGMRR